MAPQVNGSSELNMYLTQAQGMFGQLAPAIGGEASTYVNSVFTVGNSFEGLTSEDDQQKASAIQNIMNNVMSLINSIASNEAQAAKREVQNNKATARGQNKTIEDQRTALNQQIGQIGGEISAQTEIVNGAVQELTEAQKNIQEKQEQINEIITQIQAKQNELAGITDPEKQAEILSEIQGLSGQITSIASSISTLTSTVETASTRVEDAAATIEDAKGNAIEIQQEGTAEITENAQKSAQLTHTSIKTNTTGVVNTTTGEGLQVAAETASSNIFTAGTAPDLFIKANDQKLAGSERTRGAITNLQTIMQGIGGLNDNASILTNFEHSVGGALNSFKTAIGTWNQNLEPTITSLGSFSTIEGEVKTLDEKVKEDLETLPKDAQAGGQWADLTPKPYDFGVSFNENYNGGEKVKNTSGLQTPDVKLTAFEIKTEA